MSAAAFPYAELQTVAQDLIDSAGRPATLVRAERPTTANPVAGKPWVSVSKGDADTDAAAAQSIPVTAVFLSLSRRDREGQLVQLKSQEVLIGAELAAGIPEELDPEWTLVDEAGSSWQVLNSRPLQPGPLLMLYRLELSI